MSTCEDNPFATPEPHFMPGYSGHCPNYLNVIGQSYGRATHASLGLFRSFPDRLRDRSIDNPPREEDIRVLNERMCRPGNNFLSSDIPPGYTGHIPRSHCQVGLTFNQTCIKGVAEFERGTREHEKFLQSAAEERRQG